MIVKIWKINPKKDTQRVQYMSLDILNRLGRKIDSAIYDLAYVNQFGFDGLEELFTLTNDKQLKYRGQWYTLPQNYKIKPLIISDVVQVITSEEMKPGFYYVDLKGYKKLEPKDLVNPWK